MTGRIGRNSYQRNTSDYLPNLHSTISAISTFDAPDGSDRFVVLREAEFRAMHDALEFAEQLAEQNIVNEVANANEVREPPTPQITHTPGPRGNSVTAVREFRDLSLKQLAARTGLDEYYVAGIEDGSRRPTLTAMCKIAKVLNVTVDELINI